MRPDLISLLVALGICFGSMAVFGLRHHHSSEDPLESKQRGTFVLGGFIKSWFFWFIAPAVRLALKAGLPPLFFNLAGATFGIAAGIAFALGTPALGGWCVFLGGSADVFDGRVARSRGLASPKGAFLDSTLDRFAEVGLFGGLAVYFHTRPLMSLMVALALGGSLLVSYTRARGESQGVTCKVGVMQRAERLLLIGFAGLLDSSVAEWIGQSPGTLLALVVTVIAIGTIATAVYRTVWISTRLPSSSGEI
jgi:CDP-diacylglycerol--glycerol-3-phosphate 3-phosphatidyltransferase